MKVYINGLKDGHENIYPGQKPREFDVLKDERSMSGGSAKGESLYSISMTNDGCVFSKYYGIYSIPRRDYGYIAFSVFIDKSHKLSGNTIKYFLDELSGKYLERYVVDWKLDNCREDWKFVDEIVDKYEQHIKPISEVLLIEPSQNLANAFVYCQNDSEIELYLDNPCQSEYELYRQVFFLEHQNENLLNILKHDTHANLTGKIDLENPRYKLILRQDYSHSGLDVEVRANGKRKYNEDWVYRKEKLTITYSKKYCDTLVLEGKITDAELQPYLEIEEDNRRIIVKRDVDLKPASTKIKIVVTDIKERRVEDVEIKVLPQGINPMRKTPENDGGYVFVGEELGETFTVIANKNGLSGSKTFIPNQIEENVISLIIQRRKVINITVKDDNDGSALYNCDIKIEDKKSRAEKKATTKDKSTYEFLDDEIDSNYLITISKYGYEPKTFDFCPKKEVNDSIYLFLKKKEKKGTTTLPPKQQYYLEVESNKGSRGKNWPDYIENVNERNNYIPKAKKGYKFVGWEDHRNEPYNQCDGHFIAIFEETWWHRNRSLLRLAGIIGAILIVVFIVLLLTVWKKESEKPLQRMTKESFAYVEDSINDCGNDIEKLEALQKRWSGYESGIVKEGGFLGMGGAIDEEVHQAWQTGMEKIEEAINNEKAKKEATEELRKEIEDYVDGDELFFNKLSDYKSKVENDENLKCDEMLVSRLNSCIQLRTLLDEGKILQIKSYDFNYSMEQQQLINAIIGIPDKYISYVSGKLRGNITTKTINEVVKFINDKVKEKKELDRSSKPPQNPPADTLNNNSPKNKTTQQELESEFWELISQKADKTKFDALFKKSGWEKSPNFKSFYNKYLSWDGPIGTKQKPNKNEIFNYKEGFGRVPEGRLKECSRDKDLDKLTGFVIEELK